MRSRIICGPFWGSFAVSGSFAVRDHLRYCTGGPKVSRQFQFYSWNFNLLTAISILLTAISILLTAISIYSRQFRSFTQGNFNFFTATLTAFFASLTTCQLRRPTETKSMADKTQNQKWIVKVDLQREK